LSRAQALRAARAHGRFHAPWGVPVQAAHRRSLACDTLWRTVQTEKQQTLISGVQFLSFQRRRYDLAIQGYLICSSNAFTRQIACVFRRVSQPSPSFRSPRTKIGHQPQAPLGTVAARGLMYQSKKRALVLYRSHFPLAVLWHMSTTAGNVDQTRDLLPTWSYTPIP